MQVERGGSVALDISNYLEGIHTMLLVQSKKQAYISSKFALTFINCQEFVTGSLKKYAYNV